MIKIQPSSVFQKWEKFLLNLFPLKVFFPLCCLGEFFLAALASSVCWFKDLVLDPKFCKATLTQLKVLNLVQFKLLLSDTVKYKYKRFAVSFYWIRSTFGFLHFLVEIWRYNTKTVHNKLTVQHKSERKSTNIHLNDSPRNYPRQTLHTERYTSCCIVCQVMLVDSYRWLEALIERRLDRGTWVREGKMRDVEELRDVGAVVLCECERMCAVSKQCQDVSDLNWHTVTVQLSRTPLRSSTRLSAEMSEHAALFIHALPHAFIRTVFSFSSFFFTFLFNCLPFFGAGL